VSRSHGSVIYTAIFKVDDLAAKVYEITEKRQLRIFLFSRLPSRGKKINPLKQKRERKNR
jgi:hypothetical protein